jgi:Asp/Glu/hydantoin racemase
MRITLVNPNTNAATTQAMRAIAQEAAGAGASVAALTAGFGAALICDEVSLATAADAVVALLPLLRQDRPDGIIVAAFGDPGHERLAREIACPVVGIAQAGMAEAAQDGRRFGVVTTTPDLVHMILLTAERYGLRSQCVGVRVTPGDPRVLMADPVALELALLRACERAVQEDGAQAMVIGGGPLAVVGRALAHRLPVPVIEPVPAAVRLVMARVVSCRVGKVLPPISG